MLLATLVVHVATTFITKKLEYAGKFKYMYACIKERRTEAVPGVVHEIYFNPRR